MGFRGRARDWACGSEWLGRSGPGCGLLKQNWEGELRGRQQTSSIGLKLATLKNKGTNRGKEKDFFLFSENIFVKRII
jgi:hypothetical protein